MQWIMIKQLRNPSTGHRRHLKRTTEYIKGTAAPSLFPMQSFHSLRRMLLVGFHRSDYWNQDDLGRSEMAHASGICGARPREQNWDHIYPNIIIVGTITPFPQFMQWNYATFATSYSRNCIQQSSGEFWVASSKILLATTICSVSADHVTVACVSYLLFVRIWR